jgi:tetratricopeptide (TPR) repeat protein
MIALGIAFILAIDGPADSCSASAGPALAVPDTAAAAVYRAVGDDQRAAGNTAAAEAAYREALRLNPGDAVARAALEAVCRAGDRRDDEPVRSPPLPDRFDQGVALMARGERAPAIDAFESVRAEHDDPAAALLEGICEYELGNDRRAQRLFEEARREPKLAGKALLFLGLIALHGDETDVASTLLAAAGTSDASIAGTAAGLRRLASREGRVVVSALAETGYDSNVQLAPDGTALPGGTADGYGASVLGLFVRPLGLSGPYTRATAQYRRQLQITTYDLGDLGGAAGWRAGRRGQYLAAEYAYDWLSLGGAPYLSAHRLLGTGRATLGRFSVSGTYSARFESYLTVATDSYSGVRQDAQLEPEWQVGARTVVALGYHVGRDGTRDATLSYFEHGPIALLRLGGAGTARLFAEGRFTVRGYDAADAQLGVQRADRYLDAFLTGELDVAEHWTLRLATTGRRATSNDAAFQYTKLTVALGLVYTAGVL